MSVNNLIKICPTPEELAETKASELLCSLCCKTFKNISARRFHELKTHHTSTANQEPSRSQSSIKSAAYFCPIEQCKYNNQQSELYFKRLFLLKQHYQRIHTEKSLVCTKCNVATFKLERDRRYHEKSCGIGITRQKHNELEKVSPPSTVQPTVGTVRPTLLLVIPSKVTVVENRTTAKPTNYFRKIVPKNPTFPGSPAKLVSDASTQTVIINVRANKKKRIRPRQCRSISCSVSPSMLISLPTQNMSGLWTSHEIACQTYGTDITKEMTDQMVGGDEIFSAYLPSTADASVLVDFETHHVSSVQFADWTEENSRLETPQPQQDAWSHIETQTDLAMHGFDEFFEGGYWQNVETQTTNKDFFQPATATQTSDADFTGLMTTAQTQT